MGKIIPLEGLRGIASIIVVFDHFILAFLPQRHGYLDETYTDITLVGSPVFVIINGTAAVTIFFALSGYVLAALGLSENTRISPGDGPSSCVFAVLCGRSRVLAGSPKRRRCARQNLAFD